MNRLVFYSFNLLLTCGLYLLYMSAEHQFSGSDTVFLENELMKKKVEQVKLQNRLISYHFDHFQQEVASVLPKEIKKIKKKEESYPLRTLASIVSNSAQSELKEKLGVMSFKKGQKYFAAAQYTNAIPHLEEFINNYSYSKDVVKAYAMLVESYYQIGDLKKSVKATESMVDQFPQDELTGFALIRLGTILKYQERSDEAGQVFMTVMQVFKANKDLRAQARVLLGQL